MKITNIKVDLFNWTSEAWKTGVGTSYGNTQQLGVVTVETDEGVSGNSFLGSSRIGGDHFVPGLIEFIKPLRLEKIRKISELYGGICGNKTDLSQPM